MVSFLIVPLLLTQVSSLIGVIGGFNVRPPPPGAQYPRLPTQGPSDDYDYPPTPPAKDGRILYPSPNGAQLYVPQYGRQPSDQSYATSTGGRSYMSTISAVERSKILRAARMNPYLQLMVGCVL